MDESAQPITEVPVPTARRVVVRTLPAVKVMAAGLPPVLWVQLLDGTGESRSYWWPAAQLALSCLGWA